MPHIHTKPGEHDLTVSAYIVRLDKDEPRILFHKHKKQNIYMQFGGHVELNENPWQAITHELKEESGYDLSQLELLQPPGVLTRVTGAILHPYPVSYLTHHFEDFDHYHTDTAFAFTAKETPSSSVGAGESSDIRAFSAAELRAAPKNEVLEDCKEVALYILESCLGNWDRVNISTISSQPPAQTETII